MEDSRVKTQRLSVRECSLRLKYYRESDRGIETPAGSTHPAPGTRPHLGGWYEFLPTDQPEGSKAHLLRFREWQGRAVHTCNLPLGRLRQGNQA